MKQKNWNGLRVSVCQMKVVPGQPGINADYAVSQVEKADKRGVDILVLPEACISGYMIGDKFEDVFFMNDVQRQNQKVIDSTAGTSTTVIFGSFHLDPIKKGRDGRPRISNVAIVAQNGKCVSTLSVSILSGAQTVKTLEPDYRIFNDTRHFFSMLSWVDEQRVLRDDYSLKLDDFLEPVKLMIAGKEINVGVILCEDMWHDDYPFNPAEILVRKGAEIIFNLSASPWSWQKNRKRHSVVKTLLTPLQVPFIYVNNTGIQNNGKNIIVFDGSSTIYDSNGNIVFKVPAYKAGVFDFTLRSCMAVVKPDRENDTKELFEAILCAGKEFVQMLPEHMRKIIIGLSGGIDSALMAQLFTLIVGPENVYAYNMPSDTNDPKIQKLAGNIAANLGINYEVIPITGVVEAIAKATGCQPKTAPYFNVKARARMEILATKAQMLGGVFTCNANKVETAFGYGTLDGDMAGFLALIADLVKREVYQLSDYINRRVFRKAVVPKKCFTIKPTAELEENQEDPFDYGNLQYRGYHDEMVRAFTEFRMNPEWFLDNYIKGTLDSALKLEPGHISRLFPTKERFISDLERCWNLFTNSYFKRVQSMPIALVSKRAFGYDLWEAILSVHNTDRYLEMKDGLLEKMAA